MKLFLLIAALLMAAAAGSLFAAEESASTAFSMQFLTNSAGETLVRQGEMAPTKISAGKGKDLNVSLLGTNKGAQINLIPDTRDTHIASEQFPGWSAEIPRKQSFFFGFNYPTRRIDVATSDLNTTTIPMTFPDGARVEMAGRAEGRIEFMDDGTYSFIAAGPVTGSNADGTPIRFGNVFPPLFGGKLIRPASTNNDARFARATPVTQVTFLGNIGSDLKAKVGELITSLIPGAAQKIRAQNGGEISLTFDPKTRYVEWDVQRGAFRFVSDSISCWKALGMSGQKGAMQWDTNGLMMELKNRGGSNAFQKSLLVNLNPQLNVAVGESATFQYGRTGDCSTFVTSAHGGETTLYNAQSGDYVRLDAGNVNVVSGAADTSHADKLSIPFTKVQVEWAGGEVLIQGAGKPTHVPINADAVFSPADGKELHAAFRSNEDLTLTARSGNFAVSPSLLPGVSIDMSEGAVVVLGYFPQFDIIQVRSSDNNISPIAVRTPTGFYPRLEPGTKLTFVINRSPFASVEGEATLIFTESAGGGNSISGGVLTPGLLTRPTGLTQPRVDQPPVTTLE